MADDLGWVALAILLVALTFGAVVPVIPTGPALSAAAVLAHDEARWELALVLLVGWLGAYLGDLIVFVLLSLGGVRVSQRVPWLRPERPALVAMRQRLQAHDIAAMTTARLIPAGRLPLLAAAAFTGYPRRRLLMVAAIAAAAWAGLYVGIGVLGGALVPQDSVALAVGVLLALAVGLGPRLVRKARSSPPA